MTQSYLHVCISFFLTFNAVCLQSLKHEAPGGSEECVRRKGVYLEYTFMLSAIYGNL